ncbi:hypothetical protein [Flavobacterium sp.]|uniref:hypothetical protein n=1 Tax=Flavobacterium sp. TaxID=239 RepID=UPI002632D2D8|nr:hypothetical protein [Flavobacterium sp.]
MEPIQNAGESISLDEAKTMTRDFRNLYPNSTKGYMISAVNIQQILNQDGCQGLRIYNGYDAANKATNLVIVGTDSSGNDLYEGVIMDRLTPCPSSCDASSPLCD